MKSIEIIMGLALVSLGIITSVTDTKDGRIYNRTLLIYSAAGILLTLFITGILLLICFFFTWPILCLRH